MTIRSNHIASLLIKAMSRRRTSAMLNEISTNLFRDIGLNQVDVIALHIR